MGQTGVAATRRHKIAGQLRLILAANIQERLTASGKPITTAQKAVAAKAGVSLSTMQRICQGEAGASLDKIEDIAEAMGVSVVDLLRAEVDSPPQEPGRAAHSYRAQVGDDFSRTAEMSENNTRAIVAKNLRALLDLRAWSERTLAKQSGVAQKTINNILTSSSACTVETAGALANALGLHAWHLLIPDLPQDLVSSPSLGAIVADWINATPEGREHIEMVAWREARFAQK